MLTKFRRVKDVISPLSLIAMRLSSAIDCVCVPVKSLHVRKSFLNDPHLHRDSLNLQRP